MFSLDQLAAVPPFSVLASVFLVIGLDYVGLQFLKVSGFVSSDHLNHKDWLRWQSSIIGSVILAVVLYPLALLGLTHFVLMQGLAIALLLMGCIHFFNGLFKRQIMRSNWRKMWSALRNQSIIKTTLAMILIGMGLTSLGPVTSADALDNHIGSAIAVLNDGGLFGHHEWFHHRLSGNGEVLNAVALSIGAEQFGSLLQFTSLLAIVGALLFVHSISKVFQEPFESRYLIALAGVSAPVVLFLTSAPKPQMWPISMTVLAFVLSLQLYRQNATRAKLMLEYSLVCVLVMVATQAKFNYILGGGLVGIMAFVVMTKQGYFRPALCLGLLIAIVILLPPVALKAIAFDTSLIDAFISPLPGDLPGTRTMVNFSQFNADSASLWFFPLSIFIPSHIGGYGVVLGMGWLLFVGLRPGHYFVLWVGVAASIIIIIANVLLAPPAARMYMEPYFWLLLVLAMQEKQLSKRFVKVFSWPVLGQSVLAVLACSIGAVTLFPGALSPSWRSEVMDRSANGYEVMQWVDKVLPENAVLLSEHRSMALVPRKALSVEWVKFVDMQAPETEYYLNIIRDSHVSHILVIGPINYNRALAGCYGAVLAGPGVGHTATRNPFNQGGYYEAWIMEFESERLPGCVQSN
ncbi:DUF1420 family protein [Candidatus Njordibacter sp. Uisw_039]|uniref:DUF1420 family protein n=1 Tax=Candidatus Njordibacter sp. Uisw_039 TaxID=3230972 RepID=UPI003D463445